MDMKITPARLSGTVDAISSKSFVHRLLISAAIAEKPTRVELAGFSDDILATMRCLAEMGAAFKTGSDELLVSPLSRPAAASSVVLPCGESGSTARFLLPLAAHFFDRFTLTGTGRLPGRPFAPLCKALADAGCVFDGDTLPLTGRGHIRAGDFLIPGNVSSQFISGLLFVLPLLDGDSRVTLTAPLESAAYVDMTIEVLALFGITVEKDNNGFRVRGNRPYVSPGNVRAEGDWSNAAFFLCMGAMSGDIQVSGLSPRSAQGDREVMDILRRFGAEIEGSTVRAKTLRAIDIDAAQIPDLVPALAVTASVAEGVTRIYNAERLRIKESDRIQSTFNLLSGLGADIEITRDGLLIRGKEKLRGGVVDGAGDHRIVMAAAEAACVCEKPVIIKGSGAVNKSYPSFFEDFRRLGGVASIEGGTSRGSSVSTGGVASIGGGTNVVQYRK